MSLSRYGINAAQQNIRNAAFEALCRIDRECNEEQKEKLRNLIDGSLPTGQSMLDPFLDSIEGYALRVTRHDRQWAGMGEAQALAFELNRPIIVINLIQNEYLAIAYLSNFNCQVNNHVFYSQIFCRNTDSKTWTFGFFGNSMKTQLLSGILKIIIIRLFWKIHNVQAIIFKQTSNHRTLSRKMQVYLHSITYRIIIIILQNHAQEEAVVFNRA